MHDQSSRPAKRGPKRRPTDERFAEKVQRGDACWRWTASHDRHGYGWFMLEGKLVHAHRAAWVLASGAPIPPGMVIGHVCDVRDCVRTDDVGTYLVNDKLVPRIGHLWMGTFADNSADMVAKHRQAAGETHGSALHPERWLTGDDHWSHRRPDRLARGERHGNRIHSTRMNAAAAEAIRQLRGKEPLGVTAQRYGVSKVLISQIQTGKRWAKH